MTMLEDTNLEVLEKQLECVALQLESAIQHIRQIVVVIQQLRRPRADFNYQTGTHPDATL